MGTCENRANPTHAAFFWLPQVQANLKGAFSKQHTLICIWASFQIGSTELGPLQLAALLWAVWSCKDVPLHCRNLACNPRWIAGDHPVRFLTVCQIGTCLHMLGNQLFFPYPGMTRFHYVTNQGTVPVAASRLWFCNMVFYCRAVQDNTFNLDNLSVKLLFVIL